MAPDGGLLFFLQSTHTGNSLHSALKILSKLSMSVVARDKPLVRPQERDIYNTGAAQQGCSFDEDPFVSLCSKLFY